MDHFYPWKFHKSQRTLSKFRPLLLSVCLFVVRLFLWCISLTACVCFYWDVLVPSRDFDVIFVKYLREEHGTEPFERIEKKLKDWALKKESQFFTLYVNYDDSKDNLLNIFSAMQFSESFRSLWGKGCALACPNFGLPIFIQFKCIKRLCICIRNLMRKKRWSWINAGICYQCK